MCMIYIKIHTLCVKVCGNLWNIYVYKYIYICKHVYNSCLLGTRRTLHPSASCIEIHQFICSFTMWSSQNLKLHVSLFYSPLPPLLESQRDPNLFQAVSYKYVREPRAYLSSCNQHIPSQGTFESMIFLFSTWDILVSSRIWICWIPILVSATFNPPKYLQYLGTLEYMVGQSSLPASTKRLVVQVHGAPGRLANLEKKQVASNTEEKWFRFNLLNTTTCQLLPSDPLITQN